MLSYLLVTYLVVELHLTYKELRTFMAIGNWKAFVLGMRWYKHTEWGLAHDESMRLGAQNKKPACNIQAGFEFGVADGANTNRFLSTSFY